VNKDAPKMIKIYTKTMNLKMPAREKNKRNDEKGE